MTRLRCLEALRAIAAIMVLLYHAQVVVMGSFTTPLGQWISAGHRGVDLFFVLSGFIIAHVHAQELGQPARLPSYLFKRFVRIYPAVWIVSLPALLLYALAFGGDEKATKLELWPLLASGLLLPQEGVPLVNVTWTLTYEVFFYALFALVIAHRRLGLAVILAWQGATLLLALHGADLGLHAYYLRSLCLDFGVGLACAWLLRQHWFAGGPGAWFLLVALGVAGFAGGMALDEDMMGHLEPAGVLCALGSGAVILGLVRIEQAGRLRVPGAMVRLGEASYSIYLVHFSVVTLLAVASRHLDWDATAIAFIVCVAGGVLAGLLFDRWIERPLQRCLRGSGSRWKPGSELAGRGLEEIKEGRGLPAARRAR